MPEIEAIKEKSYEETTMAEAIVLFFAGDESEKKDALNRITYLQDKNIKNKKESKSMHLGLTNNN